MSTTAENINIVNPGDRIKNQEQRIQEKSEQIAVDTWDIVGHVVVPTYFVIEHNDGSKEALHHIRDAEEISDIIRQARMEENGERKWW